MSASKTTLLLANFGIAVAFIGCAGGVGDDSDSGHVDDGNASNHDYDYGHFFDDVDGGASNTEDGDAGKLTADDMEALTALTLDVVPCTETNAKADLASSANLGRKLFFDRRLSGPLTVGTDTEASALGVIGATQKIACIDCHQLANGGADTRSASHVSIGADYTPRNSPTVVNAAYSMFQGWDGGRDSMWMLSTAALEAGAVQNTSRLHVAHVIAAHHHDAYTEIFGAPISLVDVERMKAGVPAGDVVSACDETEPTELRGRVGDCYWNQLTALEQTAVNTVFANAGKALEAYMRRLTDTDSAFDRFVKNDVTALTTSEQRGAKLFLSTGCVACHSGGAIGEGAMKQLGVPQDGAYVPEIDRGFVEGIHKLNTSPFTSCGSYSDDDTGATCTEVETLVTACTLNNECEFDRPTCDVKPGQTTGVCRSDNDLGAFKVPTLRNVGKTAPYMHTGGYESLESVLWFYFYDAGRDVLLANGGDLDGVGDRQLADLAAFLRALDGDALDADVISDPFNGGVDAPFTDTLVCE